MQCCQMTWVNFFPMRLEKDLEIYNYLCTYLLVYFVKKNFKGLEECQYIFELKVCKGSLRNSYTKLWWIFYLNYSCWCCLALGVRLIWHCSWGLTDDGWGMRGLKTHVQITTITITRNIRKRQKKKPLMKPHVQSCDMVFGYWSLNLSTTYSRESGQKRIHFHT